MAARKSKTSTTKKALITPNDLTAWAARYLEWMRVHHYAGKTMYTTNDNLRWFIEWCATRSITAPTEINLAILERYQQHVFHIRKANGKHLATASQASRLISVKMFFRWLVRQHVLMFNPAADVELPRRQYRLPKFVLSPEEAEVVLNQPDVGDPIGLRDRVIMEVFYSTGIRRSELISLLVTDVDFGKHILYVRQGKGRKDRMVPIGERALAWVTRYLEEVRPQLAIDPDEGVLFLTAMGDALNHSSLSTAVTERVKSAKLGKEGSCHLFRHSMATSMLENGADVRMIQAILGHASLISTQIYTHVAIRKLQEVHAVTHPAASLETRGQRKDAQDIEDDD